MFINKASHQRNNLCGDKIKEARKEMKLSQRELADLLQLKGMDVHKNAIQRIESGQRFVTDIELSYIAMVLNRPYTELIDIKLLPSETETKENEKPRK